MDGIAHACQQNRMGRRGKEDGHDGYKYCRYLYGRGMFLLFNEDVYLMFTVEKGGAMVASGWNRYSHKTVAGLFEFHQLGQGLIISI